MKFTANDDNANVGLVFFNPENTLERLNLPDSMKCQHTIKLTKGHCLFSDMGRVFASIVQDDVGWHDGLGGTLSAADMIAKKWETTTFQKALNNRTQTGYDSFIIELHKWGLAERDLPGNLSLFSKVEVANGATGALAYAPNHTRKGDSVTLRFEMDTLVVLNTCPHPLDPATEYPFRAVEITLAEAEPPVRAQVLNSPEAARGFENNRLYYLGSPGADKYFANVEVPEEVATKRGVPKDLDFFANAKPTTLVHSTLDVANAVSRVSIDAGDNLLVKVSKGQTVRITDVEGNEAADTLFYNASDISEHFSYANTISHQQSLYLTTGTSIMSDRDNELLQIVADTCTRHDCVGGACASESNTVRYGLCKREMHSCRDNWMLGCARYAESGLTKRDIAHNINFFMNVPGSPEGELDFADGISGPGKYVELKASMDVYVLVSNCPQLNNPCSGYNPTPLEVAIWN